MNILILAPSAELYGSDRILLHMCDALRSQEISITVALPSIGGPLEPRLREKGVDIYHVSDHVARRRYLGLTSIFHWIINVILFYWGIFFYYRCRHQSFDLVITNTAAVITGPLTASLLRTPHIWYVHEIVQGPTVLVRLIKLLIGRSSARIIANSQATARQFSVPTLVVPNPVPLEIWVPRATPPEPTRIQSPRPSSLRFGCVGRIRPSKGQHILLQAWEAARLPHRAHSLHFFGDILEDNPSYNFRFFSHIEQLRKQSHNIYFHGFCQDRQEIYGGVDVLVIPSISPEGFGLVAAEAIAALRPVIATRIGALPEVVAHMTNGLLVDPANPVDLSGALTTIARDRQLIDLFVSGCIQSRYRFQPETYRSRITAAILGES